MVLNAAHSTEKAPGTMLRALLAALVIISAFAVVYVKDMQRRLFMIYQQRDTVYEQQLTEWGQLVLEVSTLSRQDRIAKLAEGKLHMQMPAVRDVHLIKINGMDAG